ncbi:hypothetical protein [Xanthomonas arboricola]|uniref:hypothetical protein n=1 Tax=Xanthomonas arboricola TaxID=56448 RepID=UPI000CEF1400|nr:hypothetical protein [Xanthomonas arboricola]PPU39880.1 hypothetical protein XaplCFBP3123_13095 [Xanthomonas arboricola pv. populi]
MRWVMLEPGIVQPFGRLRDAVPTRFARAVDPGWPGRQRGGAQPFDRLALRGVTRAAAVLA